MSFRSSLFNCKITRKRVTSRIVELKPYADGVINILFPKTYLRVEIKGFSEGTGTITLLGDVSEDFTFFGNGYMISRQEFSRIDSVESVGLLDEETIGSLLIEGTNATGLDKIKIESTIDFYGRISAPTLSRSIEIFGPMESLIAILYAPPDLDLKEKDIILYNGNEYSIMRVHKPLDSRGMIHHIRCDLGAIQ